MQAFLSPSLQSPHGAPVVPRPPTSLCGTDPQLAQRSPPVRGVCTARRTLALAPTAARAPHWLALASASAPSWLAPALASAPRWLASVACALGALHCLHGRRHPHRASTSTLATDEKVAERAPAAEIVEPVSLAAQVRADFPALSEEAVYLDSAATAQKPTAVIDAVERYYRSAANVHRGSYAAAARVTEEYEEARQSVARFIGAADPAEVVFTSGATEAINLVAQSWGGANVGPGDEIVCTAFEHHSNIVPWQLLAQRTGATVKFARFTGSGELDLEHFRSLLTPRTKLVAVAHVSNTLGCITPVKEVAQMAREVGALILVDACQSAPHLRLDVQGLGADFLVASGHKMYGPTGIGFLWGRRELLEAMPPWQGGGEMIKEVRLDALPTFAELPAKFEAGTPPIAQAVGLGAACEYLMQIGMDKIEAHESALAARLWRALSDLDGLTLYGPPADRGRAALLCFNDSSGEVYPADIASLADVDGFSIRSGKHCAQPAHIELDAPFGSARVSLGMYNTVEEVDAFAKSLRDNLELLRSGEGCMFDPENPDDCACTTDRGRS